MFKTKKDVDKHVQDINAKIKSSTERNLKGYSIAKLYFGVGDYENARRYLASYLVEKDTSSVAHKLNGSIFEQLKQPEKALACYKKSYELDQSADLVSKICQLMTKLPIEPGRAKYWVEVGEKTIPHSDVVYKLREAMLTANEGENSPALEQVLLSELQARPTDVTLRVRLVTLYQRTGRIQEGYQNAVEVEQKQPWPSCLEWYRCLVEMCENYQVQYKTQCQSPFYTQYLAGLDRLADIQAREGVAASNMADTLHRMDQALYELGQLSGVDPALLSHFRGQLYLATATLIIKRAVKDPHSWRESSKLAGLMYLQSYHQEVVDQYRELGGVRRVVAGHIMFQMAGEDPEWGERLAGQSNVGDRLHRAVFVVRDQREKMATSCLAGVGSLTNPSLPSLLELSSHCPDYLRHHKESLHHLTWLLLRYYCPTKVLDLTFPLPGAGLASKEQMSGLDLDIFLYGVVYCVGWAGEGEGSREGPPLPPSLSPVVTSTVQEGWWKVACRALDNTLQPQDRRVLMHGVEALRCMGLHGLDINLTMKLGKTLESLALESQEAGEGDQSGAQVALQLEERAALYYRASLASISLLERGQGLREPSLRLLPPAGGAPSQAELEKMKDGANFFLACQLMHINKLPEAVAAFRELRSPYASFYSGEILKKMALEERAKTGLGDPGEMFQSLLVEAREALYLTLDRLRGSGGATHPLDSQLSEHIEEVEHLINSSSRGVEEASVATPLGTPRSRMATPVGTPRRSILPLQTGLTSTPARSLFEGSRSEARPSPERLDAQMRQLTNELGRTTTQLARTLSHVENEQKEAGDRDGEKEELVKLVEQGQLVVDTGKQVLVEVQGLASVLRDLLCEVREGRTETNRRQERVLELLGKVCENTGREQQLTEEERLLLDSFGYGGGGGVASAMSAQMMQQQMIQQHLARQTPNMLAMAASAGLTSLYPGAMFNPMATANPMPQLPPTLPHQLPVTMAPMVPPQLQAVSVAPVIPPQLVAPVIPPHLVAPVILPQPTASVALSVAPHLPMSVAPQAAVSAPTTPKVLPSAPTNVVISMSDPIPVTAPPHTTMTVTVPPQHRLGVTPRQSIPTHSTPLSAYSTPQASEGPTLHSYQIKMPAGASPLTQSPFDNADTPAVAITTQSLMSTIPNPVFSAVTPSPEKPVSTSSFKTRMSSGHGLQETPKARNSEGASEQPEEYEPEVEFAPVIPLPEVVDIVTGEEEETVLFEDRAKLFRFSPETKEWKERGLGQAKILSNKQSGKVRFLMRREQTFKVCANHSITPEIKIELMKGNKKARIWGAQDFADEEVRTERFCIRFKTEEQAEKFEAEFKSGAESAKHAVSPVKEVKKTATESTDKPAATTLAQFAAAQKSGNWECSGCLTRNDNAKLQCLACETAKPGHEEEVAKVKEAAKPAAPVMTIGAGGGFKFGGSSSTTEPISTSAATSSISAFSFGTPKTTTTTTTEATGFSFGAKTTTTSGFSFGTPSTPATDVSSKPSVGGFTFNTAPTVVTPKVEEKKEEVTKVVEEVAKPSPFSGFSFGAASASSPLAFGSKTEAVKESSTEPSNTPLFGAKPGEVSSFGALAGSGEGIKKDPEFTGFSGTGSSVFGSQKKSEEKKGDDEGGADEEYEPDVHFTPVVPLPELIEVKTGEEEETALFSGRSKLFRFVPETKEWKERGIGEFKILENNSSKKVRFLMRREQVLKVCCNHVLTKAMEFKPLATSDRAWTWTAADFSEGEIKNELFALRFKTAEMASNWKSVVDDSQANISDSPQKDTAKESTLENKVVKTPKPAATTLAQFAAAQKSGNWECSGCLTRNDNAKLQCLACETAKPGHEEEVAKAKEAAKAAAPVMTIGAGGGFKFGTSDTTSSPSGFSFGTPSTSTAAVGTASSSSGFSFGTPSASTTDSKPATSGFAFGGGQAATNTNGGFSFSQSEDVKPPFGTTEKHEFSFSGVAKSPGKGSSPRKHNVSTTSETDELYQNDEEEGDNLYFEPVIPLPDKVEVVTGEEDETVLYSHRAKLFRLLGGEWKERGLGDIKILRNEGSGKVRLLMRREQVLKICLNHNINQEVVSNFTKKDTKAWTWAAMDFSDGELESMTFALRFKTPEIAAEFKDAVDGAVRNITASPVKAVEKKESSRKSPEKSKSKSPEVTSKTEQVDDKELFPSNAFKPVEEIVTEKELSFEGQGLKLNTAEDAVEVADKIRNHPSGQMHVLTFSANTVGIEAAGAIGKALETRPEFRRAHWKDMFTGRMKTEIPPALVNLTRGIMTAQARLVELDLSDNAFGPVGMEGLVTFLQSPSCFSLRELKLNNTGCGVTGGKMLANLLLECYNKSSSVGHPLALRVFVLGRSRQENEGATALAKVFKLMGSLEEVVMPQNGIYHEGLAALADAFANNPNLRILNMNDNTFTATGARAMGKALKKLNKLEVLNLGDCLLKTAGAKLICRALKGRHPQLKELILDSNEIRVGGGLEIAELVKDKSNIERFSIGGNQFGEEGLEKIMKKLKDMGKADLLTEVEDNEDPDSDEEDPDLSDEDEEPEENVETPVKEVKSPQSIFSGTPKATSSIFGGSASSSLFGSTSSTPAFKPSGNMLVNPTSSSSIFGTPTAESPSSSVFSKPADSSLGLFNKPASEASATPVFGTSSTPSFGTSVFGQSSTNSPSSSSIFGGSSASSAPSSGGLFGKPAAAEGKPDSTTTSASSVFGSTSNSTGFNFGSLATSGEGSTGFKTAGDGFKFAGAGSSLFGKKPSNEEDNEDDENADEDDGHDPHFEPVVPLPELVVVKTGEEEETVLFKHRAKVYRYCSDTKQWKERGVGDIKILRHPATGIHRVLLRRDQVHKIAANHRITVDMVLQPLASSETAWCWYAMDFSEGHEVEGSLEQLAVRFKNKDSADDFKAKFEACQRESPATDPDTSSKSVVEDVSATAEEAVGAEDAADDDYEGYDEEDYEDNGETIMFHQTAVLSIKNEESGDWMSQGEVDFRIMYDDDVYGARIIAEGPTGSSEDYNCVCNHLIAMQTILSDTPDLAWSALDFSTDPPSYRTFMVEFSSPDITAEFKDMFAEGKDLAENSEILETVGDQDPAMFYYGQGADNEA